MKDYNSIPPRRFRVKISPKVTRLVVVSGDQIDRVVRHGYAFDGPLPSHCSQYQSLVLGCCFLVQTLDSILPELLLGTALKANNFTQF